MAVCLRFSQNMILYMTKYEQVFSVSKLIDETGGDPEYNDNGIDHLIIASD